MALLAEGLVTITMDQAEIRQVVYESRAVIANSAVLPYAVGARQAQIEVEIANPGDLPASYVAIVTDCTGISESGVPFQIASLNPDPLLRHTFNFRLTSDTAFVAGANCRVQLKAPTGRLYDEKTVTFPGPT